MPKLVIDDLEIEVPEGTKVIEAAERLGIMIPRFCYHEAMGSIGACRMCAVKFLQGPFKGVQMSCMISAQDGMVVSTTDEEAVDFRKHVIEWLMLNHPHDCPVCDEGGQCLLQDETVSGGHGMRRFWGKKRTYRDQYLGPFIAHEMNRCIHCYRCSRFYQIFSGYRDLGSMQIGSRVYFGRYEDGRLENPFSGNLVDICPTGVYTDKTARYKVRRWDLRRAQSLCIHCSLGCNTIANTHYRGVMRIEARFNEDVNGYFICDLGRFGFSYTNGGTDHEARPWQPKIGREEASYDHAVVAAAKKLSQISETAGPSAIASLGSMRNSLETLCMLRRLYRMQGWREPGFFINPSLMRKVKKAVSRLNGRLAVSLREIERADFILAVGVDPVNEAPMLAYAMRQAFRNDASIVVIDPRSVSLPFDFVHLPVSPQNIDTCLGAFVRLASEPMKLDEPAPLSFLAALPEQYPFGPNIRDKVSALALKLQESKKPVIICGTDVVAESTPSAAADHASFLKSVKEGAGLFYLLPGPNAFGAALLSSSEESSFMATLEAIEKGAVKALLVVENDLFRYFPDRQRLESAIGKLDLLVVLDYLPSEAVNRAEIFLPTSTVFEAGASYINQEGRVQFSEKAHPGGIPVWGGGHPQRLFRDYIPGGEHKAAFEILSDIAHAMHLPGEDLSVHDPLELLTGEIIALAGIGRQHYPINGVRVLSGESHGAPPMSSIRFRGESGPSDVLELIVVEWLFGTEELSSYSDTIQAAVKEPALLIHPDDAARIGLSDAERVSIGLDRGRIEVKLDIENRMAPGILILPRHRQIAWQKIGEFPALVSFDQIRRI